VALHQLQNQENQKTGAIISLSEQKEDLWQENYDWSEPHTNPNLTQSSSRSRLVKLNLCNRHSKWESPTHV
jgi:hypothetical protein